MELIRIQGLECCHTIHLAVLRHQASRQADTSIEDVHRCPARNAATVAVELLFVARFAYILLLIGMQTVWKTSTLVTWISTE